MNTNPINFSYLPSKLHRNNNLSPIKPRQKMPTVYRHRYSYSQQIEDNLRWPRNNDFYNPILGDQVNSSRSSNLIKNKRQSYDNPQCMSVHSSQFKKDNTPVRLLKKSNDLQHLNISSSKKQPFDSNINQNNYYSSFINSSSNMKQRQKQSKGFEIRKTLNHLMKNQSQVTQKIGSIEFRDYTIYRPQLKVGSNVFIDTYSPF